MPGAHQLALGIGLSDSATFDNFYSGANAQLVAELRRAEEPFLLLWGRTGSGKSHLLQALCHETGRRGLTPAYLPLKEVIGASTALLEDLEQLPLICIDDVQAVAGRGEWEEALFALYNRVREVGAHMVVTASGPPASLGIALADLVSRLGWGPVYQLHGLDDEQKIEALQLRARRRGLELPEEVGRYLLKRVPRDTHTLFAWLDRLDQASLIAQRRLTVPFVRAHLEQGEGESSRPPG